MSIYDAISVLEDEDHVDAEVEIEALQALINSGTWGLQGSYGRAMMDAIESGYCALGEEGCRDYYGNYIPSRHEVESGTKGSIEFVEARSPYGRVIE